MNDLEKIIIDCDPGVDDFSAISLAVKSNRFNILGITTVAGNCSLENATNNAFKALNMVKRDDIPVYKGMDKSLLVEDVDATYVHGNNGLGGVNFSPIQRVPEKENAVDYLVRIAKEYPGEITLVPIGPLTNIAMAIKKDPKFTRNIKRVILMGGAETRW